MKKAKPRRRLGLKTAALLTLFCFVSGELLNPVRGYASVAPGAPEVKVPSSFSLQIPSQLGSVEMLHASSHPDARTVIHIQEAHGNYAAQKSIEQILHYLNQQYGVRLILLEGNAAPLKPELLEFAEDKREGIYGILEELARKSLVSGPELYFSRAKGSAYGIEELEVYKENGERYAQVLREKEKTEGFVKLLDMQIERLTSPYLPAELRQFLKRESEYEEGRLPLMNYLEELKGFGEKHLKTDVSKAPAQLEWPMLVRLFTLKRLEKNLNLGEYRREREGFLKTLKQLGVGSEAIEKELTDVPGQAPLSSEAALIFERMVSKLPRDFNYAAYPNVNRFIGYLILRSELDGKALMAEAVKLSDEITAKLCGDETQKHLTQALKNYRLLKKLFALELTPAEFETVRGAEFLLPSAMLSHLKEMNQEKRVKDLEAEKLTGEGLRDLDSLYASSIRFYELAKSRDEKMIGNVEKRLTETGEKSAVVITGGFHSAPFEEHFKERDDNFARITPRLDLSTESSAYKNLMMEGFKEKTQGSTMRLSEALIGGDEGLPLRTEMRARIIEFAAQSRTPANRAFLQRFASPETITSPKANDERSEARTLEEYRTAVKNLKAGDRIRVFEGNETAVIRSQGYAKDGFPRPDTGTITAKALFASGAGLSWKSLEVYARGISEEERGILSRQVKFSSGAAVAPFLLEFKWEKDSDKESRDAGASLVVWTGERYEFVSSVRDFEYRKALNNLKTDEWERVFRGEEKDVMMLLHGRSKRTFPRADSGVLGATQFSFGGGTKISTMEIYARGITESEKEILRTQGFTLQEDPGKQVFLLEMRWTRKGKNPKLNSGRNLILWNGDEYVPIGSSQAFEYRRAVKNLKPGERVRVYEGNEFSMVLSKLGVFQTTFTRPDKGSLGSAGLNFGGGGNLTAVEIYARAISEDEKTLLEEQGIPFSGNPAASPFLLELQWTKEGNKLGLNSGTSLVVWTGNQYQIAGDKDYFEYRKVLRSLPPNDRVRVFEGTEEDVIHFHRAVTRYRFPRADSGRLGDNIFSFGAGDVQTLKVYARRMTEEEKSVLALQAQFLQDSKVPPFLLEFHWTRKVDEDGKTSGVGLVVWTGQGYQYVGGPEDLKYRLALKNLKPGERTRVFESEERDYVSLGHGRSKQAFPRADAGIIGAEGTFSFGAGTELKEVKVYARLLDGAEKELLKQDGISFIDNPKVGPFFLEFEWIDDKDQKGGPGLVAWNGEKYVSAGDLEHFKYRLAVRSLKLGDRVRVLAGSESSLIDLPMGRARRSFPRADAESILKRNETGFSFGAGLNLSSVEIYAQSMSPEELTVLKEQGVVFKDSPMVAPFFLIFEYVKEGSEVRRSGRVVWTGDKYDTIVENERLDALAMMQFIGAGNWDAARFYFIKYLWQLPVFFRDGVIHARVFEEYAENGLYKKAGREGRLKMAEGERLGLFGKGPMGEALALVFGKKQRVGHVVVDSNEKMHAGSREAEAARGLNPEDALRVLGNLFELPWERKGDELELKGEVLYPKQEGVQKLPAFNLVHLASYQHLILGEDGKMRKFRDEDMVKIVKGIRASLKKGGLLVIPADGKEFTAEYIQSMGALGFSALSDESEEVKLSAGERARMNQYKEGLGDAVANKLSSINSRFMVFKLVNPEAEGGEGLKFPLEKLRPGARDEDLEGEGYDPRDDGFDFDNVNWDKFLGLGREEGEEAQVPESETSAGSTAVETRVPKKTRVLAETEGNILELVNRAQYEGRPGEYLEAWLRFLEDSDNLNRVQRRTESERQSVMDAIGQAFIAVYTNPLNHIYNRKGYEAFEALKNKASAGTLAELEAALQGLKDVIVSAASSAGSAPEFEIIAKGEWQKEINALRSRLRGEMRMSMRVIMNAKSSAGKTEEKTREEIFTKIFAARKDAIERSLDQKFRPFWRDYNKGTKNWADFQAQIQDAVAEVLEAIASDPELAKPSADFLREWWRSEGEDLIRMLEQGWALRRTRDAKINNEAPGAVPPRAGIFEENFDIAPWFRVIWSRVRLRQIFNAAVNDLSGSLPPAKLFGGDKPYKDTQPGTKRLKKKYARQPWGNWKKFLTRLSADFKDKVSEIVLDPDLEGLSPEDLRKIWEEQIEHLDSIYVMESGKRDPSKKIFTGQWQAHLAGLFGYKAVQENPDERSREALSHTEFKTASVREAGIFRPDFDIVDYFRDKKVVMAETSAPLRPDVRKSERSEIRGPKSIYAIALAALASGILGSLVYWVSSSRPQLKEDAAALPIGQAGQAGESKLGTARTLAEAVKGIPLPRLQKMLAERASKAYAELQIDIEAQITSHLRELRLPVGKTAQPFNWLNSWQADVTSGHPFLVTVSADADRGLHYVYYIDLENKTMYFPGFGGDGIFVPADAAQAKMITDANLQALKSGQAQVVEAAIASLKLILAPEEFPRIIRGLLELAASDLSALEQNPAAFYRISEPDLRRQMTRTVESMFRFGFQNVSEEEKTAGISRILAEVQKFYAQSGPEVQGKNLGITVLKQIQQTLPDDHPGQTEVEELIQSFRAENRVSLEDIRGEYTPAEAKYEELLKRFSGLSEQVWDEEKEWDAEQVRNDVGVIRQELNELGGKAKDIETSMTEFIAQGAGYNEGTDMNLSVLEFRGNSKEKPRARSEDDAALRILRELFEEREVNAPESGVTSPKFQESAAKLRADWATTRRTEQAKYSSGDLRYLRELWDKIQSWNKEDREKRGPDPLYQEVTAGGTKIKVYQRVVRLYRSTRTAEKSKETEVDELKWQVRSLPEQISNLFKQLRNFEWTVLTRSFERQIRKILVNEKLSFESQPLGANHPDKGTLETDDLGDLTWVHSVGIPLPSSDNLLKGYLAARAVSQRLRAYQDWTRTNEGSPQTKTAVDTVKTFLSRLRDQHLRGGTDANEKLFEGLQMAQRAMEEIRFGRAIRPAFSIDQEFQVPLPENLTPEQRQNAVIRLSPDGKFFVVSVGSNLIYILDVNKPREGLAKPISVVETGEAEIVDLAVSPDSSQTAILLKDNRIFAYNFVWDNVRFLADTSQTNESSNPVLSEISWISNGQEIIAFDAQNRRAYRYSADTSLILARWPTIFRPVDNSFFYLARGDFPMDGRSILYPFSILERPIPPDIFVPGLVRNVVLSSENHVVALSQTGDADNPQFSVYSWRLGQAGVTHLFDLLRDISPPLKPVIKMSLDGRYVAAGLGGAIITLFDTQRNEQVNMPDHSAVPIRDFGFSPDGNYFYTIDQNGLVQRRHVYPVEEQAAPVQDIPEVYELYPGINPRPGADSYSSVLDYSLDGSQALVSVRGENFLNRVNLITGEVDRFQVPQARTFTWTAADHVQDLSFSPAGDAAAVLTRTGRLYILNFETGNFTPMGVFDPVDINVVRNITWNPQGEYLILEYGMNAVRHARRIDYPSRQAHNIVDAWGPIRFTRSGEFSAAPYHYSIIVWRENEIITNPSPGGPGYLSVVISEDSGTVAGLMRDGEVMLWNRRTNDFRLVEADETAEARHIQLRITPNGEYALFSRGTRLYFIEPVSNRQRFYEFGEPIANFDISPDGLYVLVHGTDNSLIRYSFDQLLQNARAENRVLDEDWLKAGMKPAHALRALSRKIQELHKEFPGDAGFEIGPLLDRWEAQVRERFPEQATRIIVDAYQQAQPVLDQLRSIARTPLIQMRGGYRMENVSYRDSFGREIQTNRPVPQPGQLDAERRAQRALESSYELSNQIAERIQSLEPGAVLNGRTSPGFERPPIITHPNQKQEIDDLVGQLERFSQSASPTGWEPPSENASRALLQRILEQFQNLSEGSEFEAAEQILPLLIWRLMDDFESVRSQIAPALEIFEQRFTREAGREAASAILAEIYGRAIVALRNDTINARNNFGGDETWLRQRLAVRNPMIQRAVNAMTGRIQALVSEEDANKILGQADLEGIWSRFNEMGALRTARPGWEAMWERPNDLSFNSIFDEFESFYAAAVQHLGTERAMDEVYKMILSRLRDFAARSSSRLNDYERRDLKFWIDMFVQNARQFQPQRAEEDTRKVFEDVAVERIAALEQNPNQGNLLSAIVTAIDLGLGLPAAEWERLLRLISSEPMRPFAVMLRENQIFEKVEAGLLAASPEEGKQKIREIYASHLESISNHLKEWQIGTTSFELETSVLIFGRYAELVPGEALFEFERLGAIFAMASVFPEGYEGIPKKIVRKIEAAAGQDPRFADILKRVRQEELQKIVEYMVRHAARRGDATQSLNSRPIEEAEELFKSAMAIVRQYPEMANEVVEAAGAYMAYRARPADMDPKQAGLRIQELWETTLRDVLNEENAAYFLSRSMIIGLPIMLRTARYHRSGNIAGDFKTFLSAIRPQHIPLGTMDDVLEEIEDMMRTVSENGVPEWRLDALTVLVRLGDFKDYAQNAMAPFLINLGKTDWTPEQRQQLAQEVEKMNHYLEAHERPDVVSAYYVGALLSAIPYKTHARAGEFSLNFTLEWMTSRGASFQSGIRRAVTKRLADDIDLALSGDSLDRLFWNLLDEDMAAFTRLSPQEIQKIIFEHYSEILERADYKKSQELGRLQNFLKLIDPELRLRQSEYAKYLTDREFAAVADILEPLNNEQLQIGGNPAIYSTIIERLAQQRLWTEDWARAALAAEATIGFPAYFKFKGNQPAGITLPALNIWLKQWTPDQNLEDFHGSMMAWQTAFFRDGIPPADEDAPASIEAFSQFTTSVLETLAPGEWLRARDVIKQLMQHIDVTNGPALAAMIRGYQNLRVDQLDSAKPGSITWVFFLADMMRRPWSYQKAERLWENAKHALETNDMSNPALVAEGIYLASKLPRSQEVVAVLKKHVLDENSLWLNVLLPMAVYTLGAVADDFSLVHVIRELIRKKNLAGQNYLVQTGLEKLERRRMMVTAQSRWLDAMVESLWAHYAEGVRYFQRIFGVEEGNRVFQYMYDDIESKLGELKPRGGIPYFVPETSHGIVMGFYRNVGFAGAFENYLRLGHERASSSYGETYVAVVKNKAFGYGGEDTFFVWIPADKYNRMAHAGEIVTGTRRAEVEMVLNGDVQKEEIRVYFTSADNLKPSGVKGVLAAEKVAVLVKSGNDYDYYKDGLDKQPEKIRGPDALREVLRQHKNYQAPRLVVALDFPPYQFSSDLERFMSSDPVFSAEFPDNNVAEMKQFSRQAYLKFYLEEHPEVFKAFMEQQRTHLESNVQNVNAGSQGMGSQEGALVTIDGKKYYAKFYEDEDRMRAEFLAWMMMREAGLPVAEDMNVAEIPWQGRKRLAVLSEWKDGASVSQSSYSDLDLLALEYVMSALLQDRDRGKADNYLDAGNEKLAIDFGGSLIYRSRGGLKGDGENQLPFGLPNFLEMMAPDGMHRSKVFYAGLRGREDLIQKALLEVAGRLSQASITRMVQAVGFKNKEIEARIQQVLVESLDEIRRRAAQEIGAASELSALPPYTSAVRQAFGNKNPKTSSAEVWDAAWERLPQGLQKWYTDVDSGRASGKGGKGKVNLEGHTREVFEGLDLNYADQNVNLGEYSTHAVLRLAAFFHDSGKLFTKEEAAHAQEILPLIEYETREANPVGWQEFEEAVRVEMSKNPSDRDHELLSLYILKLYAPLLGFTAAETELAAQVLAQDKIGSMNNTYHGPDRLADQSVDQLDQEFRLSSQSVLATVLPGRSFYGLQFELMTLAEVLYAADTVLSRKIGAKALQETHIAGRNVWTVHRENNPKWYEFKDFVGKRKDEDAALIQYLREGEPSSSVQTDEFLKRKVSLVAVDFDDTISESGKPVAQEMLSKINELLEAGIYVLVISGTTESRIKRKLNYDQISAQAKEKLIIRERYGASDWQMTRGEQDQVLESLQESLGQAWMGKRSDTGHLKILLTAEAGPAVEFAARVQSAVGNQYHVFLSRGNILHVLPQSKGDILKAKVEELGIDPREVVVVANEGGPFNMDQSLFDAFSGEAFAVNVGEAIPSQRGFVLSWPKTFTEGTRKIFELIHPETWQIDLTGIVQIAENLPVRERRWKVLAKEVMVPEENARAENRELLSALRPFTDDEINKVRRQVQQEVRNAHFIALSAMEAVQKEVYDQLTAGNEVFELLFTDLAQEQNPSGELDRTIQALAGAVEKKFQNPAYPAFYDEVQKLLKNAFLENGMDLSLPVYFYPEIRGNKIQKIRVWSYGALLAAVQRKEAIRYSIQAMKQTILLDPRTVKARGNEFKKAIGQHHQVKSTEQVMRDLRAVLAELAAPQGLGFLIYGSYAQGDGRSRKKTELSDLDFSFVWTVPGEYQTWIDAHEEDVVSQLRQKGYLIDPIGLDPQAWDPQNFQEQKEKGEFFNDHKFVWLVTAARTEIVNLETGENLDLDSFLRNEARGLPFGGSRRAEMRVSLEDIRGEYTPAEAKYEELRKRFSGLSEQVWDEEKEWDAEQVRNDVGVIRQELIELDGKAKEIAGSMTEFIAQGAGYDEETDMNLSVLEFRGNSKEKPRARSEDDAALWILRELFEAREVNAPESGVMSPKFQESAAKLRADWATTRRTEQAKYSSGDLRYLRELWDKIQSWNKEDREKRGPNPLTQEVTAGGTKIKVYQRVVRLYRSTRTAEKSKETEVDELKWQVRSLPEQISNLFKQLRSFEWTVLTQSFERQIKKILSNEKLSFESRPLGANHPDKGTLETEDFGDLAWVQNIGIPLTSSDNLLKGYLAARAVSQRLRAYQDWTRTNEVSPEMKQAVDTVKTFLSDIRDQHLRGGADAHEKLFASLQMVQRAMEAIRFDRGIRPAFSVDQEFQVPLPEGVTPEQLQNSVIRMSPDGKFLMVSLGSNFFYILDTENPEESVFRPVSFGETASEGIVDMAVSPDNTRIAVLLQNNSIYIYDLELDSQTLLNPEPGNIRTSYYGGARVVPGMVLSSLSWHASGRSIFATNSTNDMLYDYQLNRTEGSDYLGSISNRAVNSLGQFTHGQYEPRSIVVVVDADGVERTGFLFIPNLSRYVALSDGAHVAALAYDRSLENPDFSAYFGRPSGPSNGRHLFDLPRNTSAALKPVIRISPDGRYVAAGLGEAITLFDTQNNEINMPERGTAPIRDFGFSPDGNYFYTIDQNGLMQRRHVQPIEVEEQAGQEDTRPREYPLTISMAPPYGYNSVLDFSPDGSRVLVSVQGSIDFDLVNLNTGEIHTYEVPRARVFNGEYIDYVQDLTFSPAGDEAALLTRSGRLYILNVETGDLRHFGNYDPIDTQTVQNIRWPAQADYLILEYGQNRTYVTYSRRINYPSRYEGEASPVGAYVYFTRNGHFRASPVEHGVVIQAGEERRLYEDMLASRFAPVVISENGNVITSVVRLYQVVIIWNRETGDVFRLRPTSEWDDLRARITPDESYVLYSSGPKMFFADPVSGRVRSLEFQERIANFDISPDGRYVLVHGTDNRLTRYSFDQLLQDSRAETRNIDQRLEVLRDQFLEAIHVLVPNWEDDLLTQETVRRSVETRTELGVNYEFIDPIEVLAGLVIFMNDIENARMLWGAEPENPAIIESLMNIVEQIDSLLNALMFRSHGMDILRSDGGASIEVTQEKAGKILEILEDAASDTVALYSFISGEEDEDDSSARAELREELETVRFSDSSLKDVEILAATHTEKVVPFTALRFGEKVYRELIIRVTGLKPDALSRFFENLPETIQADIPNLMELARKASAGKVPGEVLHDLGASVKADGKSAEEIYASAYVAAVMLGLDYKVYLDGTKEDAAAFLKEIDAAAAKHPELSFVPSRDPHFSVTAVEGTKSVAELFAHELNAKKQTVTISGRAVPLPVQPGHAHVRVKNEKNLYSIGGVAAALLDELVRKYLQVVDDETLEQNARGGALLKEIRILEAFLSAA